MLIYNLIEYSNNYSKTFGLFWQYYSDETNATLRDSELSKSKVKRREKSSGAGNTKDVQIEVSLKHLGDFCRTLEMPLFNWEVNLILTWSSTCIVTSSTGAKTFAITDTKLYI